MESQPIHLLKSFSDELDPAKLRHKFLTALLKLQNVERGSIWIKQNDAYVCIESAGLQSENIKGTVINASQSSIVGWVIENGKMTISDPRVDPRHYRELEEKLAVKSSLILCFPLFLKNDKVYGAVQIIDTTPGKTSINLDHGHLRHIQDLVNIGSIALSNAILFDEQRRETQSLRQALEQIRQEDRLIGQSPSFQTCMGMIRSYARTDYPILISGESGTGKELIARNIHQLSPRSEKPLWIQNCSAIPETLLESELFGYKKGAFSGAAKDKLGLFEAADGGTVFLDEIGDMPLNLQARILRVIQNSEVKPLGETRVKKVDIKIISATNQNLPDMVEAGTFRKDLFYRLSVLPLHIPPLRNRKEDIPLLLKHFLQREALSIGVAEKRISNEALQALLEYDWPGNIRELENLIRYLLVVTDNERILQSDLPSYIRGHGDIRPKSSGLSPTAVSPACKDLPFTNRTWAEVEREFALHLLNKNNWNVARSASDAGLNRSTFVSRMKRLGIGRPQRSSELPGKREG
ncbi:MAG: sigma-54 interaction domain-containing protein [Thermodesulfobacteriota bacterium]